MNNSITITINYANGEKYEVHSPDVARGLIHAFSDFLKQDGEVNISSIDDIDCLDASRICLMKALDDYERTL